MTDRPSWAPEGIDITRPSVSRIYDYFLGGSHNFEVDRRAAEDALRALPGARAISLANRAVMHRAIRFATSLGIDQFLDVGAGIPTAGSTHEVARAAAPGARVVYVDHDPVAVAHSQAVLDGDKDAAVVAADLREPETILEHPETRRLLDMGRPVALMLVAVVHFLPDEQGPAAIIGTLRDALAPGSVVVVTHATLEGGLEPAAQQGVQAAYRRTTTPLVMRSAAELAPLFAGFDVVAPGIVPLPHWRPDPPDEEFDPAVLHGLVGVGVKP